jgi:hypothetical protein
MPPAFTHKKRKGSGPSAPPDEDVELTELTDLRLKVGVLTAEQEDLRSPFNSEGAANMKSAGDRRRLLIELWKGNYSASSQRLRDNNIALVATLYAQLENKSDQTDSLLHARDRMVDGMLLDICRGQNQNMVPVLSAAMSILGEFNHIPREYHDSLALYHRGAALSEKWVRDFLVEARAWRPDPPFEVLLGVPVAVFDNLSMKVDYSSYSSGGETGYKLDMTTWLSTPVPRALAPTMDARQICKRARACIELTRASPDKLAMCSPDKFPSSPWCLPSRPRSSQWHDVPQGCLAASVCARLLPRQPRGKVEQGAALAGVPAQ